MKRFTLSVIAWLLLSVPCYGQAATMYATAAGAGGKTGVDWDNAFGAAELYDDPEFQVFERLLHRPGKPDDLWKQGFRQIKFFSFPMAAPPSDARVAELAASVAPGGIAFWDLEMWNPRVFDGHAWTWNGENYARLQNALTVARANQSPLSQSGIFGTIPPRFQNASKYDYGHHHRQSHREFARRVEPLTDYVDVLFPCFYCATPVAADLALWQDSALIVLSTIKQTDKPIYAFLSPQITGPCDPLISAGHWRGQLDFCYEQDRIDGVVLFGCPGRPWDEDAGWLRATERFMADRGLDRPVPAPFVADTGSQR